MFLVVIDINASVVNKVLVANKDDLKEYLYLTFVPPALFACEQHAMGKLYNYMPVLFFLRVRLNYLSSIRLTNDRLSLL